MSLIVEVDNPFHAQLKMLHLKVAKWQTLALTPYNIVDRFVKCSIDICF